MLKPIVFLLCLFVVVPFFDARAGNLFMVERITVDARAQTASTARNRALRDGERRAFAVVLKRLTRAEDWPRLPDTDAFNVVALVQDIRVTQEKRSGTRYLATLAVTFKADAIRQILRDANVPIIEAQGQTVLLAPIFENREGIVLDARDIWRMQWEAADIANHAVSIVLLSHDESDISHASLINLLRGDQLVVEALQKQYGVSRVIVAHALGDVPDVLNVRSVDYTQGEAHQKNYRYEGNQKAQVKRAVDELMEAIATDWKRAAAIDADEAGGLLVRTQFRNFATWQRVVTKLKAANLVKKVTLHELSSRVGFFTLSHVGTMAQLQANLRRQNLALEDKGAFWEISIIRRRARR